VDFDEGRARSQRKGARSVKPRPDFSRSSDEFLFITDFVQSVCQQRIVAAMRSRDGWGHDRRRKKEHRAHHLAGRESARAKTIRVRRARSQNCRGELINMSGPSPEAEGDRNPVLPAARPDSQLQTVACVPMTVFTLGHATAIVAALAYAAADLIKFDGAEFADRIMFRGRHVSILSVDNFFIC
jgi:hypothetical protein